jgi:guanylate kinase
MNKVVLTLTGPSCSGKSTIEKRLYQRGMHKTISTTTRAPRAGERDGDAYYFVGTTQFMRMIAEGELVEHVNFGGNYYGLTKAEFEAGFKAGKAVVAVVEPNGRNQIAKFCNENGWRHVAAFIDSNPQLMLRRIAKRTEEDLENAAIISDEEPLVTAEKHFDTFIKRLTTIRQVEFNWMREARRRQYLYTAYIRVSTNLNFEAIIRFLEATVRAYQEPGTMFPGNVSEPFHLGDAGLFEPWMDKTGDVKGVG